MMALRRPAIPARDHRWRLWFMAAAGFFLAGSAAADPPRVEPGQWRITWNLLSIKGRGGIPPEYLDLQTLTEGRCLDRVPVLPLPPGHDRDCQVDLESAVAETIRWRGTCQAPSGQARQVSGTIRYRERTLDGALSIHAGAAILEFELRGRQVSPACR